MQNLQTVEPNRIFLYDLNNKTILVDYIFDQTTAPGYTKQNKYIHGGYILDENNKVVSNPGGTEPKYIDGELQLMIQKEPIFKHCHDVCIDQDENIYVCQWNAAKSYPIKLTRV